MKRIIPAAPRQNRRQPSAHELVWTLLALHAIVVTGCQLSGARRGQIDVRIEADGQIQEASVPAGSTVAQALSLAGINVADLDRTEPPSYTVLGAGDQVRIVRVEERFRTEIRAIPFERQLLRNESLPEGEERLVQAGKNGREEMTFRAVLEDGVQISEVVIKSTLLDEPLAEILMIGARSPIAPVTIPGALAYLSAGNAWIMQATTANRRLIVNTGDLDGRVFSLSSDAKYLLFTRRSDKPADEEINTLWLVPTEPEGGSAFSLEADNIVHYAGWYPGPSARVAYSTVEPRANAPGWQANNDFYRLSIGGTPVEILDAQSGGVYGWWGTDFAFSPDGRLAYARPDGIGLVSQEGGYLAPLASITPLQTHGDWAWTPGMAWGADSQTLFYVDHVVAQATLGPEESSQFDLRALSLESNSVVSLAENVGMFASPSVSPPLAAGGYVVAFLQAIFPEQSEVSRYRLAVMDRDGSNRREVFPAADLPGLDPLVPIWAPAEVTGQSGPYLCIVYQGDIWLVDSGSGQATQITGDGLISGVDWR